MRDIDLAVEILRTTRTRLAEKWLYEPFLSDYDRCDLHTLEVVGFLVEHGLIEADGAWKTGYGPIGFLRVTWRGHDLLDNLDYVGEWEEMKKLANRCSFDVFEKIVRAKALKLALESTNFDPALFCSMRFDEHDRYYTKGGYYTKNGEEHNAP